MASIFYRKNVWRKRLACTDYGNLSQARIFTSSTWYLLILFVFSSFLFSCTEKINKIGASEDWKVSLGDKYSSQYSHLDQITRENVDQLEVAWTYRSGDADTLANSQIQANPLIIDGTLYSTTPHLNVVALDAATGNEKWRFNPFPDSLEIQTWLNVNRGVTYWENGNDKRILFTAGPELYAIDASNGELVESFGEEGTSSLKAGFPGRAEDLYVVTTSPGIVFENLIIIGSRVSEGSDAAPGDIRAFNVRTGELEWTFHTIPHPGEFGYDTWEDPDAWQKMGGANSWPGMALDEERGIVYVPTGSASPDFYGGNRKGSNLFANSLLALDASTGKRIWHYQTVHHDLWDRDLPSAPNLVTVTHDGEEIDAVSQTTKTGFIFLFDREIGEPLFPIEETEVPTDTNLEGEEVWPTQPIPVKPEPMTRQYLPDSAINPYVSEEIQADLKNQLQTLNRAHMYEPPSLKGTLMVPGYDGGAEWGGSAFDPETGILYVNSSEVPWTLTMVPAETQSRGSAENSIAFGQSTYMSYCIACHGPDRQGTGNNPTLIGVDDLYTPQEMLELINTGRRMMPGFNHLSENRKKSVVNFLIDETHFDVDFTESDKQELTAESESSPYVMTGYNKFRTPEGYPASSPPWGTLNAINLNTGEYVWKIPFGEYPELAEQGVPTTGTENYGGPVVTAGGVLFIAATLDEKIRAFDKETGNLLWEYKLPVAGFATPSVYSVDGKQYVVIACGGGKLGTKSGDYYIAFALPNS
ncbi:MAG: PQQ-binding-like beta-propeller repeat protein [Balneolaceae bacterium]|nr:PQQ-binding-like beta-propeller repeat protein [Balneolaceae bacterium]MDR9408114.1 PQQ-binding-like beta-propeller repeat protein [Balneolaceae bacterium]